MAKVKTLWCCVECGHTQLKWSGSCPACQRWNTLSEERALPPEKNGRFERFQKEETKPLRLSEIRVEDSKRYPTQMAELDRVLGGGLVAGSLTLIGGDPGIGKSTLMLQVAEALALQGLTVLYVSGEESLDQIYLRAKRMDIHSENIYFFSETNFSYIQAQIEKIKPDILIIDSIQILYITEIPSAAGSVTQVRELATSFLQLSKGLGVSTFLIGHVTKGGDIAGPKVLEHIVDTVLEFDGDRHHGYRMLRTLKNRFGPTDEVALFQMKNQGLEEIVNPSLLFLQEQRSVSIGSSVVPTVEGSRALLIEVQALVIPSAFATSTRKCTGFDPNRLALLLAVIEKRMGFSLHNSDVFVSMAGGLRIVEPAVDLGVILAVASSFCSRSIDTKTAILGEVGLSGEIRSVSRIETRVKEALHLGFNQIVIPKRNAEALSKEISSKLTLMPVETLEEAIDALIAYK